MRNNLNIKKSNTHGKGIFTEQNIKKGQTVFMITGKVVNWEVKDEESSLYGPNWVGMSKNKWIDPEGLANFLNHSCEPNCGIKGSRMVVALKDIKKGDEITIDYSITEMDQLWHMKCDCGSKKCRKIIKSIQHLPKRIIKKYEPFVPTYFMRVYNKEHNER